MPQLRLSLCVGMCCNGLDMLCLDRLILLCHLLTHAQPFFQFAVVVVMPSQGATFARSCKSSGGLVCRLSLRCNSG